LDILIAEDDNDIVRIYMKLLENKTNHITVTTDGGECLRVYNEKLKEIAEATSSYTHVQPFDILILDYKMPNIDGFEVAKRIISLNPSQRIILASAYGKDIFEDAAEYFNLPIDILQKPFSRTQLIELVEKKRILPKALV
jgi:two-component system sensor histidine kinase/response regulator